MRKPFNKLTPAEAERLAILSEECGEIVQVIGKILRHGYDSCHPSDPKKIINRRLLEKEIGDLGAITCLMINQCDVDDEAIVNATNEKAAKLPKWTHHQ